MARRKVRVDRPDSCRFDKQAADRAVSFFETHLRHTTGIYAGKPFKLADWQRHDIREIFGRQVWDPEFKLWRRQVRQVYIEVPKKNGKALAVDTVIPTPSGWSQMSDLAVGDQVFDDRGRPCSVVAVSPVMHGRPCYRLTFSDGTSIVADEEHQWRTWTRRPEGHCDVWTTRQIFEDQWISAPGSEGANHSIPVAEQLHCPNADLPIPPYTLGAWIGDGTSANASITVHPKDSLILSEIESEGVSWHRVENGKGKSVWTAWLGGQRGGNRGKWNRATLQRSLRESGLLRNKHIPSAYLRSSAQQRLRLLQGLMDTDGYVSKAGQCEFVTTRPILARHVLELVRSLGIKAALHECRALISGRDCGPKFRIIFVAFADTPVFALPRKKARQKDRPQCKARSTTRQIVKVEPVESVPVRCIQVDSPSRLFLAGESMVATHNSELAAGVALKLLFADDEYGAEVYGAASDREQASIVFNVAASMVRKDSALLKACGGGKNISDSRKRIVCPRWESFYHAVSAEVAGKHGYKAHGVIFDEVHAQKDRRLWEVMTFGSGDSRVQPLTFAITTAGVRGESPVAEELHEDADQILRGVVPCPDDFYPVIYGAPDDAPWDSEEVWRACNPALGDFLMLGKLREACEQAKRRPSEENSFRRLRLNQWTSQDVRVMSLDDWDACAQSFDWRDLRDRPCYVGVDLSSKLDLTSVVLVWVDDNGGIYLMPYFWVPREAVNGSRAQLDPVRFQAWEKAGAINLVDGGEIDYGEIREQFRIFRDEMRINIHQVAYDPMFARQLSQELAKDGFEVVEFRQQYTDFTPPFLALQDAVPQGKVRHNGHPVLRWNVDCLSARQTTDGRIKPSKPDRLRSRKRIDGVVATLMGLGRAIVNYGYQGEASVYDSAEAVM